MTFAIILTLTWLAFTNGSNDNFKGVATLYGSGTTSYSRARAWATITTLAGSLTAVAVGSGLAAKFTGRGLVPDTLAGTTEFALAVAIASASTIMLATRTGFPISTTHALVGSLLGAGLAVVPDSTNIAALGKSFVVPLLVSPAASLAITALAWFAVAKVRAVSGIGVESCLCVESPVVLPATGGTFAASGASRVVISRSGCAPTLSASSLTLGRGFEVLHFVSGGAVCFARGLNDAPKMAALAATVSLLSSKGAAMVVVVAMTLGGIAGGRRVAEKMSHGVTSMTEGQGLVANMVTAGLVLAASLAALPVSTTHVAVGSLFGIGAARADAKKSAIAGIVLAWFITVPVAMAQAALLARLFVRLHP